VSPAFAGAGYNVDRQKTALAVVTVPERQLLVAMHHVARVVDVERHGRRFGRIAGAVDGNHCAHQLRQFAGRRGVLPPAHRRLTGKPHSRTRQLAKRQAEARIIAQGIEVVGIFVTAGDRKYPCAQDIVQRMNHAGRIAWIGDAGGKLRANPHRTFCLCHQQNPAIRGQPTAIKGGCDFLASNRWESKSSRAIVAFGRCGLWHFMSRTEDGFDNQFPTSEQSLTLLLPTLQAPPDE